jgi:glycosyltransferase involved in cell wall biosynthesis
MEKTNTILFITHGCSLTGAPLVLEYVINHFIRKNASLRTYVACIDEPHISKDGFMRWNKRYNCFKINPIKKNCLSNFTSIDVTNEIIKPNIVYGNTILTIPHLVIFKKINPEVQTVIHIHENENVLNQLQLDIGNVESALSYIDKFIVVSNWQLNFLLSKGIDSSKIFYTPECIDTNIIDVVRKKKKTNHSKIRIIGIGTPCVRKGLDRFIEVAKKFNSNPYKVISPTLISEYGTDIANTFTSNDYEFIWIGGSCEYTERPFVKINGYETYKDVVIDPHPVIFMGELQSVYDQLHQSDIFLLLSREDPCPLVMLEALYLGLDTVTIKSSGDSHLYGTIYDEVIDEYDVNKVVTAIRKIVDRNNTSSIRNYKQNYYKELKSRISKDIVCENILNEVIPYVSIQRTYHKLNEKITYVFIDDLYPDRCLKIIAEYERYGITNIKLFTSYDIDSPYVVKIPSITSKTEYSWFVLNKLNDYIDTDFCLISQWDGFIINFDSWNDEFLNYDYIGAPWFWKCDRVVGGNGGFSLRSKRLMNFLQYIPYDGTNPEDEFICEVHGEDLIKNGYKFPTADFARTFSTENEISKKSFGFHNFTTANITSAQKHYGLKFHHSGDLGDIIYCLPFIRQMGGGVLILSADYNQMEIRCPMTYNKAMAIRELLMGTDYLYDIQFSLSRPVDIDYDLNQFRTFFIKWGDGRYTQSQIDILKKITLTQLYRCTIDNTIDKNFDQLPWLKFDNKIVISDKPIIINRTERYPNAKFPWKSIVQEYHDQILFVGTQKEYELFAQQYGTVDYYKTDKLIDLANVLSGAKLFIGNQSFPYSLVESMKITSIQETSVDLVPNCLFRRHNSYLTDTNQSTDYNKIKSFIDLHI